MEEEESKSSHPPEPCFARRPAEFRRPSSFADGFFGAEGTFLEGSQTGGKLPLEQYRRKRRFGVTPEPRGKPRPPARKSSRAKKLAFVIQKHRATALHYDFRLEWKGVMLSWAVPRGPSLDPADKRMAMPTEDHPIEYNSSRA